MDKKELLIIAGFAGLALGEDEAGALAAELAERLAGLAPLETAPLPESPGVGAVSCFRKHPEGRQILREDRALPFGDGEALLDRAPRREGRFILIPNLL